MTICRRCRHLVAHEWTPMGECDSGRVDHHCAVVGDPAYVAEWTDPITGETVRENRRDESKDLRRRNTGDCPDFSPGEPEVIWKGLPPWTDVLIGVGVLIAIGAILAVVFWT